MLRTHLAAGPHSLAPNRTSPSHTWVEIVSNNSGLEVRGIWLQVTEALQGSRKQYSCAYGIDLTSPVAIAAMLKRTVIRSKANCLV